MSNTVSPAAGPAAQVAAGYKRCDSCGAEILAQAEICPKCGVRQRRPVSKAVLLLLTFFTGGIGGHKFYLGKYWQGVLYLLFFWTSIPGLIALVEFIIYAFTSSERLNEKYSATSGGIVVAVVVIAIFGVFMVGVLAAVAIPAYQDYTQRARVAAMIAQTAPWRQAITLYYIDARKLPDSAAELPKDAGDSTSTNGNISVGPNGVLTITMSPRAGAMAGKTIVIQPNVASGDVRWDCTGGTVERRYRPATCRAP